MSLKLLLTLLLVLIIFGAGKLPKVMADLGRGFRNLRENIKDNNDKKIEERSDKNS